MGAACCAPAHTDSNQQQAAYEKRITAIINATLAQDRKQDADVLKLLLLGTGESGKSTIFRQLVHIYDPDPDEEAERCIAAKSTVHTNCIQAMRTLCEQSDKLMRSHPELQTATSPAVNNAKMNILERVKYNSEVTPEIAQDIKTLWADAGIRATFENRARFQLPDSARYFFEKIEEIGAEDYVPTYSDTLHIRARTTGIVETSFTIRDSKFSLVDVGGQRNERKKWIHCFESVTAVIFVAAVNEFDQVLYEDGETNRVVEALDLFGEICNSRWFRETSMILFLNKRDLFEEKLAKGGDLSRCFPEYTGKTLEEAADFIRERFLAQNQNSLTKQVYAHFTCATDTGNVEYVFNAVKDIIISRRLKDVGLLE